MGALKQEKKYAEIKIVFFEFLSHYLVKGERRTEKKSENGEGDSPFRKKRHPCYTGRAAPMVRAANKCAWLMRSLKENRGKSCVGAYCRQHNYQLKKGMKMPAPCRGCGLGVLCDYSLCLSWGGSTLKQRLIRKRKKAKKTFERILAELKTTQLEK